MKKFLLSAVLLTAFSCIVSAQKGVNKIGIGGELGFPTGQFGEDAKTGFGGWVKFLFGVGQSGSISFSSGYTSYTANGSNSQESASLAILPVLFGYHHVIKGGFYVEPQIGFASYQAKYTIGGQSASGSKTALTYAMGLGYGLDDIDLGIRFQSGSIESYNYSNFALRIGYNFSLKSKSSR